MNHLNKTHCRNLVLLISCLLLPCAANAERRWFQIDVLVFEQQTPSTENLDYSDKPIELPGNVTKLKNRAKSLKSAIHNKSSFTRINPADSSLARAAAKLYKSANYKPVTHLSWIQGINSEQAGKPVLINTELVTGYVQLRRGYNLHLKVEMQYTPTADSLYTINENRKVMLKKQHYFDHPRFGVVANVTPL